MEVEWTYLLLEIRVAKDEWSFLQYPKGKNKASMKEDYQKAL